MSDIKAAIDRITRHTGIGDLSTAYSNMLYGINHRGLGNPIISNRDNSGLTFFTKPDCNLTYDNLAANRMLTPLLTSKKDTLQRYIRSCLDPRGTAGARARGGEVSSAAVDCPFVDAQMPFIPLLTNNLISLSGWPDIAPQTYTSKPGIREEAWRMIDGTARVNAPFDLTANFRNIVGDPISALFSAWLQYSTSVYLGDMVPYPDYIVQHKIDYTCGIWRLILDPGRRYVQKIAKTIAFPYTVPTGAAFNFVGDETFQQSTDQINVQFACMGADYNDPILIYEFNELVAMFNADLKIVSVNDDAIQIQGRSNYVQVSAGFLKSANYHGYPLINEYTNELCWFLKVEDYERLNR